MRLGRFNINKNTVLNRINAKLNTVNTKNIGKVVLT